MSDSNISGWDTDCAGTWHESGEESFNPTCEHKTYLEAIELCASVGGRLPTKSEVESDCVRGDGCLYDNTRVWVSDTAASPDTHVVIVCGQNGSCAPEDNALVSPITDTQPVRCISDDEVTGWATHCGQWHESGEESFNPSCDLKTYEEAIIMCALAGGRLPTQSEVEGNCVQSDGCGFNDDHVWTSTETTTTTSTSATTATSFDCQHRHDFNYQDHRDNHHDLQTQRRARVHRLRKIRPMWSGQRSCCADYREAPRALHE
jgi:hypothetical protein